MQTYKIYINDCLLLITDDKTAAVDDCTSLFYIGNKKLLFHIIDTFEKSRHGSKCIQLTADNFDLVINDFKSIFVPEQASGGVILNEKKEVLFIYRRGKWDLPKGKMEMSEHPLDTAVREIEEEVGLKNLDVLGQISDSWHTYKTKKGRRVLKKTRWFAFAENHKGPIQLQAEEDIVAYQWIDPVVFLKSGLPTYQSILDVVRSFTQLYAGTKS